MTRPNSAGRTGRSRLVGVMQGGGGIKINSRERRAERTLIWVFLAFVVLWLPFFCANLTYGLCRTCEVPADVFAAFTWLGYLCSPGSATCRRASIRASTPISTPTSGRLSAIFSPAGGWSAELRDFRDSIPEQSGWPSPTSSSSSLSSS